MKLQAMVAALFLLSVDLSSAWASGPRFSGVEARHKSGPVTMRGIAHHVAGHNFTLQTTTHGSYTVDAAPPTHIVQKGRTGHLDVAEGSHVGVRGYVTGRAIRAIEIRLYPIAPKPVSIRGTISSISGHQVQIRTGGSSTTIVLTTATVIRTSNAVLTLSQLRVGDRVDARVIASGRDRTALHIHVYRTRVPLKHVRLSGTVVSTTPRAVIVRESSDQRTVGLTPSTRYYTGTARSSGPPRPGQAVTVYACCAGQPLMATSIHMRKQIATVRTIELRGTVIAISPSGLRLNTGHPPVVLLQTSTVYEVGTARTTRTGIRIGDLVAVRGRTVGSAFLATRVHVYEASRRTSTVQGTVTAVSTSSVRVLQRGSVYTVDVGNGAALHLAGHSVRVSQVHAGDRVRAVGHLNGHTLLATSLELNRPAPKVVTVRGVVTAAGASWLVVTQSSGEKETVRTNSHTQTTFGGRQSALTALFPGVHVVARGIRAGAGLQASAITASAKHATETGRLTGITGRSLVLHRSSGTVLRVDVPLGTVPRDGSHGVGLAQLGRGAYLQISGYIELSKSIRAVTVTVLHPSLDLHGVLSWQGRVSTIRTSTGESYVCVFGKWSTISATYLAGSLRPADLPTGTSVHVVGTMGISGNLAVQSLTARLQSVTVSAKTDSMDPTGLVLKPTGTPLHVRLLASTTYFQGSHELTAADIVVGDDVTVYGYELSGGVIVARKVTVHRRLLGMDGTIGTISGQSFVLTAVDGNHPVLVSASTLVIGTAGTILASGMKVHVTGYLRGDMTILATRVRILKSA
jgi:hypothetical protein